MGIRRSYHWSKRTERDNLHIHLKMDIYIPSWGRGDGMFTYFWTHLSLEISEVLCGLTSLMTQRRSHVQTFRNKKVKSKNVFKKPTWLFKKPRAFSKSQPPDRVCHDTLLPGTHFAYHRVANVLLTKRLAFPISRAYLDMRGTGFSIFCRFWPFWSLSEAFWKMRFRIGVRKLRKNIGGQWFLDE